MTIEQIKAKVAAMPKKERIARAVKMLQDERMGTVNARMSKLLDIGVPMNEVTEALNTAGDGALLNSAWGGVA